MTFVDTNILLYAITTQADEAEKTRKAKAILSNPELTLSVQVLQEFYVNATRKISRPLTPAAARGIIQNYLAWHVEVNEPSVVLLASDIGERNPLSFWDALILAAASVAGCDEVLSEDLQHGGSFGRVRVANPFR